MSFETHEFPYYVPIGTEVSAPSRVSASGTRRADRESIILDRLKRAKAEGDLPSEADPADLARYLSELRGVAKLALRNWPQPVNPKK